MPSPTVSSGCNSRLFVLNFAAMKLEDLASYSGQSVAIIGGSFDPIHYAHLRLGEQICEQYAVGLVVYVPNRLSPLKEEGNVSAAQDRYAIVELAVADNPRFAVCDCEIDRPGPSYSIDTIRALRQMLSSEVEILFVTGADTILDLPEWREPDAIMGESRVVAARRPGFDLDRMSAVLGPRRASNIELLDMPMMDISSNDIRHRVSQGRSIRYLTPPVVIDYIKRHNLYQAAQ